jgi:hypothetical protein
MSNHLTRISAEGAMWEKPIDPKCLHNPVMLNIAYIIDELRSMKDY